MTSTEPATCRAAAASDRTLLARKLLLGALLGGLIVAPWAPLSAVPKPQAAILSVIGLAALAAVAFRHRDRPPRAAPAETQAASDVLELAGRLSGLGYAVWNADTGRCEACTAEMAAVFGMPRDAFLARMPRPLDLSDALWPADRESLRTAIAGSVGPEGETRELFVRPDKAGQVRRVRLLIQRLPGPACRVMCVAQDVSGANRAARDDAEAQRMQSMGRLTSGVAHDFNNFLSVILGNLDLLDVTQDDSQRQALLEEVSAAAGRARDLTGNLLGFARRPQDRTEPLWLGNIVDEMTPLLRRALPPRVDLVRRMEEVTWPVRVERGLVDSVLMNLVLNARDAMPGGGALTISGSDRRDARGRWVVLEVTDTGEGMTETVKANLFQPFFSTRGADTNSGLGLSMVQTMVSGAGGRIEVESVPGQGSTFRVFLPADDPPDTASDYIDELRTPEGAALRILLVEDDPAVARVLLRQLALMGHRVTLAGDADAAEKVHASDGPFDLLLSDVRLPGAVQGPDLAGSLRAMAPGLAVIYLTGQHEAGPFKPAGPVLRKPVGRAELLHAVVTSLALARSD